MAGPGTRAWAQLQPLCTKAGWAAAEQTLPGEMGAGRCIWEEVSAAVQVQMTGLSGDWREGTWGRNSEHLWVPYYTPIAELSTACTQTPSLLGSPWEPSYCPHFADEETEAREVEKLTHSHRVTSRVRLSAPTFCLEVFHL